MTTSLTREDVRRLAHEPLGKGKMRHRVNLLGVGGVGSNLLRQALRDSAGERLMFRCYDDDIVELHNLNRTTMFSLFRLGQYKVSTVTHAANKLGHPKVIAATYYFQTDSQSLFNAGTIIDARDTLDVTKMSPKTWIKLAYDGGSNISFTWRPDIVSRLVFNLDTTDSYAVVPSFYVPAALLGVFALRFLEFANFREITELRAGTVHYDIDGLIDDIALTISSETAHD